MIEPILSVIIWICAALSFSGVVFMLVVSPRRFRAFRWMIRVVETSLVVGALTVVFLVLLIFMHVV